MHIITCEQVSSGHPDKICDQIADAVVTDVLRHDPQARVAIEVLIKGNQIIIAGELTSSYAPDYRELAGDESSVVAHVGSGEIAGEAETTLAAVYGVTTKVEAVASEVDVASDACAVGNAQLFLQVFWHYVTQEGSIVKGYSIM